MDEKLVIPQVSTPFGSCDLEIKPRKSAENVFEVKLVGSEGTIHKRAVFTADDLARRLFTVI